MVKCRCAPLGATVCMIYLCCVQGLSIESPDISVVKGTKLDYTVDRSYQDRSEDAVEMMIIGFIIFTMTFPFVVLVEWDSVMFLAMLSRMRKVCFSIKSDEIREQHDNFGAVHVTGKLSCEDGQQDPEVGFFPKRKIVALYRIVEEMQRVEYRSKSKDHYIYEHRLEWRKGLHALHCFVFVRETTADGLVLGWVWVPSQYARPQSICHC